ncbi:ATP-binding protein [Streptomyces sp. V1I6]|uniref:ATP-binding protein n=1 Tax=Streptomyces sp. V1I6 TaxID=3042273 RepID=UPI0027873ADC|nr:ATP-binding protein [Streptomyces sp. V1I6]MDQ0840705.1 anti-sigma regulatory factor (Ser/Thr protein kinase) [Streptomyces sp. V1I6]
MSEQEISVSRRFPLDGGRGVVARCRDLTREALEDWFTLPGADGRVRAQDALLLVSEVVTNACTHGGTPYELRIDRGPGRIRVQVSDTDTARPRPRGPHHPARASGHGLYLLDRLSDEWGWAPHGTGKAVWFVVTLPE